jgi:hypothetical protein
MNSNSEHIDLPTCDVFIPSIMSDKCARCGGSRESHNAGK